MSLSIIGQLLKVIGVLRYREEGSTIYFGYHLWNPLTGLFILILIPISLIVAVFIKESWQAMLGDLYRDLSGRNWK